MENNLEDALSIIDFSDDSSEDDDDEGEIGNKIFSKRKQSGAF